MGAKRRYISPKCYTCAVPKISLGKSAEYDHDQRKLILNLS